MPPTSAASVMKFTNCEATSVPRPTPKPKRSRMTSKTARLLTAATRPHISE